MLWKKAVRLTPASAAIEFPAGGEDSNFLPDFSRETGNEIFDFIDSAEHYFILEVLHVKRGDLAQDGEHFAAIVEIALDLKWSAFRLFRRGACRRPFPGKHLGILLELVHVDDVRERTEFVQRLERPTALPALFKCHEKIDGRGEKGHLMDDGIDPLGEVGETRCDFAKPEETERDGHNAREQNHENTGNDAHPEDRAHQPVGANFGFSGDVHKCLASHAQPRIIEALLDPRVQSSRGREDFVDIEGAEGTGRIGTCGLHDCKGLM